MTAARLLEVAVAIIRKNNGLNGKWTYAPTTEGQWVMQMESFLEQERLMGRHTGPTCQRCSRPGTQNYYNRLYCPEHYPPTFARTRSQT